MYLQEGAGVLETVQVLASVGEVCGAGDGACESSTHAQTALATSMAELNVASIDLRAWGWRLGVDGNEFGMTLSASAMSLLQRGHVGVRECPAMARAFLLS